MLERQITQALATIRLHVHERNIAKKTARGRTWYAYPMERDLIIVWAMYRGWRTKAIADTLGLSNATIKARRTEIANNPTIIFSLPVLYKGFRWGKYFYRCEFCGELMVDVGEKDARLHVVRHIISEESIVMLGMREEV